MRETLENTRIFSDSCGPGTQPALGSFAAEPDALRDTVRKALSSISVDEQSEFRNKLFARLRRAGLNVRPCLLMLGVSALTAGDLTPPEIASLIRYVRLTEQKAMMAVTAQLSELLAASESPGASDVAA